MKCKSCGAQMDPGDRFCRECGMPVGGGKKANNKEEGYADNILSKSGRFDANYFVPMAILLGVLFIISSVIRMNHEKNNPVDTTETTAIESEARIESYWDEGQYFIA
ncbi:MAG: zinc-ribbon domain-containing protein [Lachnospiraceae bacterium]|nr:zinc-ribbon domain-containing protein [Lachnospiraceae bacterium]